jgi:ATP-dependent Clp protease ATP-binding subunit ClpA
LGKFIETAALYHGRGGRITAGEGAYMFERYTEPARRTIFFARYEAALSGSRFIDPVHLVVGILREDRDLARALIGEEQRQEQLRNEIRGRSPASSEEIPVSVDLPLSHESRQALALAAEEANRLKHSSIMPVHLLIGVLRLDQPPVDVLATYGVNLEMARQHAQSLPKFVTEATGPPRPVMSRQQALHRLVDRLPENRFGAAARLLEALYEERVEVSGTDSRGSFNFKYGVPGDQQTG